MGMIVGRAGTSIAVSCLLLGLLFNVAHADVVPGDVIDKSNYQKIEGLVPDFILE